MPIDLDVVTVEGPDARKYLHSQLSQNIETMDSGDRRWTFALEPTGKIAALAEIECLEPNLFTLTTAAGFGGELERTLRRFLIRVKAEITMSTITIDEDEAAADRARVAAGWPAMGAEITPGETIPAETGIAAAAVSFTKGCYPGQELVERMDSRGAAAPRQLRIVDVAPDAAPGDPIIDPASGETVGSLTSVAGGRGLGYVRRGSTLGDPPTLPSTA